MGRHHWSSAPPPMRAHGRRVGTVHGAPSRRVPCLEAISTVFSLFGRFHIAPHTHTTARIHTQTRTHVQQHYCVMCARPTPRARRPSKPHCPHFDRQARSERFRHSLGISTVDTVPVVSSYRDPYGFVYFVRTPYPRYCRRRSHTARTACTPCARVGDRD